MDVPVSRKAQTAAKKQAQKDVPEEVFAAEAQVTSCWGTRTVAMFPHSLGTPARERHAPFFHFLRYESFL